MDPANLSGSSSAFVRCIHNHQVCDGFICFEVECLVDNLLITTNLRRHELVQVENGFDVLDNYVNTRLSLSDKRELIDADRLMILIVD